MKKILNRITITGADESIDPRDLATISKAFPQVEWGILFSEKYSLNFEGVSRFPGLPWISELLSEYSSLENKEIINFPNFSAHICGRWVRNICSGQIQTNLNDFNCFFSKFKRIQLNFHAQVHLLEREKFFKVLTQPPFAGKQIIFQLDNVNNDLLQVARESGINAVPLFDTSGGAGILPKNWPNPIGNYCGYAGGLSPENISEQLEKISETTNGPIWIDTETRVRSEDDKQFDLKKVIKFLSLADEWLI